MADVLQRAEDPRVAPRGILLGHAHHQTPDLREHARTTAAPLRIRPLARNQLPMPTENRVGCDNHGDITKAATAQSVSVHRQPTAFHIRQSYPAPHVPAQDAVLFDQVRHSVLLSPVKPADQPRQEHAKEERVEHGARVYTTYATQGIEAPRPSNATIRGQIKPPTKIKDVQPVYPAIARSARVAGVVTIEAMIGPDGKSHGRNGSALDPVARSGRA
jgi:hypothetical protein